MDKAFDLVMSVLRPQFDAMPITEDDYLGEDDLIYCAKCRTPKQLWVEIPGAKVKAKVLCDCQSAQQDREEEADRLRKKKDRIARWRNIGIESSAWHGCSFDSDDKRDEAASHKCRNYAEHFDKMYQSDTGLLLYGGLGSGKTYLAACIANKLLEEGRRITMTNLTSLIAHLGADYGNDREYWIDRVTGADLLVLDDFGVERTTEYSLEQSYEIINARYKTGRPMLITTNLTLQEMQSETNLGKRRIYDRVVEKCIPLLVQGDSRRMEIAKQKRQEAMKILEGRA